MTPDRRTALALAAVLGLTLAVAGCNRREQAEPAPAPAPAPAAEAPAPTPADAAAPLAYEHKTEHAEVKLALPQAIAGQPDLHARLYSDGVRQLRQFSEGAVADRTEFTGDFQMPAYSREVTWALAAETGKLLSLKRSEYEFTGGAHPNAAYGAVLWDKALKRILQPAQLFRRGADFERLDAALCTAVRVAKRQRLGDAYVEDGEAWSCPGWLQTPYVLAPSTTSGKAGGLTFLFGPYAVGAYAEGPYEITIPLSVFRAELAQPYADEFAGSPARTGDVTQMG